MAWVADTQIYLQILKTTRSIRDRVIKSLQQRWDKIKRLTTVMPWLVTTRHIQNEHIPKQNSRSDGRGLKTDDSSSLFSLKGPPTQGQLCAWYLGRLRHLQVLVGMRMSERLKLVTAERTAENSVSCSCTSILTHIRHICMWYAYNKQFSIYSFSYNLSD